MTVLTTEERLERAARLIKVRFHVSREHAEALRKLASEPQFEDVLTRYAWRDEQPAKRLAAFLLEQAIDDVRRSEPSDEGSLSCVPPSKPGR